jgi:GTP-binding protein
VPPSVEDIPGVTRDRVAYDAQWSGRAFTVVDTGGWDPDAQGIAERIRAQAEVAVTAADAVLFVVDATVGITDADEQVVRVLRGAKKPVVLAANKVDDRRTEAEATSLWNLGLGEPWPVSALHGRGSGDLLDAILAALPEAPPERLEEEAGPRRVAIVGKPNVGKSSLLNRLAGEERVVVDDVAGTTVDPVDELVQLGGRPWRFVTPPASASGSARRPATSTTRRCAPRPPSSGPRWRSWCWTRRSRCRSRTSASSAPSPRPAGPS